jgi:hypothetical protein
MRRWVALPGATAIQGVGDKTLFHIEAVAKFIDGLPAGGKRGLLVEKGGKTTCNPRTICRVNPAKSHCHCPRRTRLTGRTELLSFLLCR